MLQVICECGNVSQIDAQDAEQTIRCGCGLELAIPSLAELQEYADDGRPAPALSVTHSISSNESDMSVQKTEYPQDEDGYRIVIGDVGRNGTISQSALMHFVAAADQKVQQCLEEYQPNQGCYLQVSIGLLPGQKVYAECESDPVAIADELCEAIERELEQLNGPPITSTPIGLCTIKVLIGQGLPSEPQFTPFAKRRELTSRLGLVKDEVDDSLTNAPRINKPWQITLAAHRAWDWLQSKFARRVSNNVTPKSPEDAYFEARDFFFSYLNDARRANPEIIRQTAKDSPDEGLSIAALADLYAREGELEQAIRCYSNAIDKLPGFSLLLALRGKLYEASGNTQKALRDYTNAIDQQPFDPWFFQQRAEIFSELEAYEQVESDLNEAHALDPGDPEILISRSVSFAQRDQISKAIDDLESAVVLDPYNPVAHKLLGRLLQVTEPPNHGRAVDMYSRVLEVNPEDDECLLRRASTYEMQQKFELALTDCNAIIERQPENAQAYALRGNIHQKQGDFEDAVADCSMAIEYGFDPAFVYIARGISFASLGQTEQAQSDCEAALLQEPTNPVALYFKGRLALSGGEVDAAMEAFDQACELEPDWMEPRAHRAFIHRIQSNPRAAVDEQSLLIGRDPGNEANYVNRAFAYAELGEYELAEADFNRAIELAEDNEELLYLRGLFYFERRHFDFALRDFNHALRIDPQHENALLRRAQTFLQQDDPKAAYDDLCLLVQKNPEDGQLYVARMQALIEMDDDEGATKDVEKAIELLPEEATAIRHQQKFSLAQKELSRGNYEQTIAMASELIDEAEEPKWAYQLRAAARWRTELFVDADEDYSTVIELDEETISAYSARGQVRAELGEFESALTDLEKAIEMSRKAGDVLLESYSLNGRALCFAGLGRFDESTEDFEESIRLGPENAWTHYNRGIVLYHRGESAAAAEHLRKALTLTRPQLPMKKRLRAENTIKSIEESLPDQESSS